jgi:hypothetical protein
MLLIKVRGVDKYLHFFILKIFIGLEKLYIITIIVTIILIIYSK